MIAYLDSSAVIKQYLSDESGGVDVADVIARSARVATARLTYVEVHAGLAAARRANQIARETHAQAIAAFDNSWDAFWVIELSPAVGTRAGTIADTFGLRAGDAIQLASAVEMPSNDIVMVAWDARLRFAANAAGVSVYPAVV